MTRTGDREIGVVSGRLPDNPGELACMPSLYIGNVTWVFLKRRLKNEDLRPKTPWTKMKTPWTKTKTPWTKTKTPWTKTKTAWTKTKSPWTKTRTPWTKTNKNLFNLTWLNRFLYF